MKKTIREWEEVTKTVLVGIADRDKKITEKQFAKLKETNEAPGERAQKEEANDEDK